MIKTKVKNQNCELVPYQIDDNKAINVTQINDDVWLSQKQMAELFDIDKSVITKHLKNIFKEQELDKNSVSAFFAHTANDGKKYNVNFYNLDAIISVGYRVNSKRGVMFRQWATKIIKERIKNEYAQQTIKKIDDKLDITRKECAKLINRALKAKGFTQATIGKELGLNKKTVWSCINGVHSNSRVFQWIEDNVFNEKSSILDNLKNTYKLSDTEIDLLEIALIGGKCLRNEIFRNILKVIQYDQYEEVE